MAQTISLNNFVGNTFSTIKLTNDVEIGATIFPVTNSVNYTSGLSFLLGNPGSPTCEILVANDPTTSVAISSNIPSVLPHNSGEQLALLFGTSLRIYRAPDQYGNGRQPDDSRFSLLATINIDPTQDTTIFTDSDTGRYWYKYTFYNVNTTQETNLSDSDAMQAGQVHYVSLQQIRDSAGFGDAPQLGDDKIARFRDAAECEVNGALAGIVSLPFPQPINPIIVQIVKNIAAGELMQDSYNTISPVLATQGATKSGQARKGGGAYTSLQDLVERTVVLQDANYADLTVDDAPGFQGFPNATANTFGSGADDRRQFSINEEY